MRNAGLLQSEAEAGALAVWGGAASPEFDVLLGEVPGPAPPVGRLPPRRTLALLTACGLCLGAFALLWQRPLLFERQQDGFLGRQSVLPATGPLAGKWSAAEASARQLVATLSQESKMSLVQGSEGGLGYAGFLAHKGLPGNVMPLKMQDGPQGFNPYQTALAGTATQFPALLSVAASFSPDISRKYAAAVADEFVTKGANVLLGPDVEVTRAVLTGRCFETISGEDPYLGSQLVRPYIEEIQNRGIIATVKHWLDNNQEIYRQTMNAKVPERAQHEIYMPVFQAAFEAGAAAVMCSYNNVNGEHACENSYLLKKLLREELGFKGYVVSDWGATHDALKSAQNGLDIEMPTGKFFAELPSLIGNGTLQADVLDNMATHVLSAMYFVGHFDGRFPADKSGALGHVPACSDGHRAVALETIIESAVLLKNAGNVLPLATAGKKIAMVGKYCNHSNDATFSQGSVYSGGGSGFVMTTRTVRPFEGMQQLVKDATIILAPTAAEAAGADVAVVCAAAHAEEGWDRKDLVLPDVQGLLAQLRSQGGTAQQIIVLAAVPGAVTTEWIDQADAVLVMFEPGEQVGIATAQLLTGQASPGGRLPVSFPQVSEKRFTPYQYPGLCADNSWCDNLIADFSEDVLVGYRWNDAKATPSAFPFGFGLTYTDFQFSNLRAACTGATGTVTVTVTNTGAREGSAVPQLYVGFPSLAPVLKQLKGFQKIKLPAGGSSDVTFTLTERDLSYWDQASAAWVSANSKGEQVSVTVGASSADLAALTGTLCGGATSGGGATAAYSGAAPAAVAYSGAAPAAAAYSGAAPAAAAAYSGSGAAAPYSGAAAGGGAAAYSAEGGVAPAVAPAAAAVPAAAAPAAAAPAATDLAAAYATAMPLAAGGAAVAAYGGGGAYGALRQ